MPEHGPYVLAGWAAYAIVAFAALLLLNRRWRGTENGLNPVYVALSWPIVLPLLAVYYVGALCYTGGIVLRGRRSTGMRA